MTARWLGASTVLVALSVPGAGWAHVGSPNVTAAGDAGPYHLSVMIRPPPQAPGVATVEIDGGGDPLRALRVSASPLGSSAPSGAPPVVARRSAATGKPTFTAELWIGAPGSWRLAIAADGDRGAGELSVIVPQPRRIGVAVHVLIVGLRIVLALGLVIFMGRTAGKSRRRTVWTVLAAAGFIGVAVTLGRVPRTDCSLGQLDASVVAGQLGLRLADRARGCASARDGLVPDHGHLLHLFLLRLPGLDRVLHLHPMQVGDGRFIHDVPELSAGRYRVYADIVDSTGAPATAVGEVTLPAAGGPLTGDDAAGQGAPIDHADLRQTTVALPDGARLIWNRDAAPLRSGRLAALTFRVEDARGAPAGDLQPYMGMLGHAVVVRHDLAVFAHVHPSGSVPMAAAAVLDGGPDGTHAHACETPAQASSVTFPYGFPSAGTYRIVVQIKRNDRIETALFDARVEE